MNPFGTHLRKPSLEWLGFLGRDGLDDAEHTLQIGEILFLEASRRAYDKGVDNLSPPFGKFRFTSPHLGKVILRIFCIGKYRPASHQSGPDSAPF